LVEEFAHAGVEVVFVNRPIAQTPEDTLLLQLQSMFAEYERARIVERSRRGKRHLAQAGAVSVLGRAPYGYRYIGRAAGNGTARFEVVEDKAAVVRRIFGWVAQERISLTMVCQRLFEAGVPGPTGNARWDRSTVWVLLSNPAYAGQALFGKVTSHPWRATLCPTRGRAPIPKYPSRRVPALPESRIAIPVPPLVEAALFEGAQEQLEESRRRCRLRKQGVRYLLQGLLVCQSCGYAFCGRWKAPPRSRGRRYHYYRCTGTDRSRLNGQRRCEARPIRVEQLDTAVWDEVCRLLADPARVTEEYQHRLQAVCSGPRRPELETVERQLTKLRGGMGRLIDSYAEGVISKAEFEPRLAGMRQRVAKLETEAAALQDTAEQARSLQLVIGKLEVFAALVRDRLEDADWDTRRDVIRTLVRRIEIDGQRVRVVFRVDPGPQDGTGALRVGQRCLGRDCGMGGRATHDPRWAALVFTARHPDGAHATRSVPPGLPASRGPARLRHRSAWPYAARAGPYNAQSSSGDAGRAAATERRRWGWQ
jgi:site-specific DNA recombinase